MTRKVLVVTSKKDTCDFFMQCLAGQALVLTSDSCAQFKLFCESMDVIIIDTSTASLPADAKAASPCLFIAYAEDHSPIVSQPAYHAVITRSMTRETAAAIIRKSFEYTGMHRNSVKPSIFSRDQQPAGFAAANPQNEHPHPSNYLKFYRQKEALKNFSKIFNAVSDTSKLLDLFIMMLKDLMSVSRIVIFLAAKDEYHAASYQGYSKECMDSIRIPRSCGLIELLCDEAVILTKQTLLAAHGDIYAQDAAAQLERMKCAVAIPLFYEGTLTGFIAMNNKITAEHFTSEELDLVHSLSCQIAICIENTKLSRQLSESKTYIEQILQNMNSGVISINSDFVISACNEKAAHILNTSPGACIGANVGVLPSELSSLLKETAATGKEYIREELLLQSLRKPIGVNCSVLRDSEGITSGSVAVFTDMTYVLELEARRREDEHIQFINKVATRSSHELKNCLVSIKTFTQLLPEKYIDKDFRSDFYSVMNKEVDRLNLIVENLLFFSKVLNLSMKPAALNTLVEKSIQEIDPKAGSTVKIDIANIDPAIFIQADEEKIIKAFSCIVRNSIQAIPYGGAVSIHTALIAPKKLHENQAGGADQKVKISFIDNGGGIDDDELPRIFEPFYTTKTRGMGLGLTIAKKIVEEHGGSIYVTSKKNSGTTVEIVLPHMQNPSGQQTGTAPENKRQKTASS